MDHRDRRSSVGSRTGGGSVVYGFGWTNPRQPYASPEPSSSRVGVGGRESIERPQNQLGDVMKSVFEKYSHYIVGGLIAIAFLALGIATANAQTFKVATGGSKGTYAAMLKEVQQYCGSELSITEVPSSGSMENINSLIGNQVNGAFVQADVLFYRNRTESLANVKTLMALHPEEVHVVALTQAKEQTLIDKGTCVAGKCFGQKSAPAVYKSVEDLSGYTVGAWGGSVITAQVIRLQSEIPFKVVEFNNDKEALNALADGSIQAILAVGGSPLGFIRDLGKGVKLLGFTESTQERLKGVYNKARLNYTNVTDGLGVSTVSTNALFVVWDYKKNPKVIESLGKLRSCVFNKLGELQETTGTHPKWKLVADAQLTDATQRGKWVWYELPTAKLEVVPARKR